MGVNIGKHDSNFSISEAYVRTDRYDDDSSKIENKFQEIDDQLDKHDKYLSMDSKFLRMHNMRLEYLGKKLSLTNKQMGDFRKEMNEFKEEQKKENKFMKYILVGMAIYMVIITILFLRINTIMKRYESPKSMEVIMYDINEKKEIHYSAFMKIDTENATVELQETKKTKEVDINKVE